MLLVRSGDVERCHERPETEEKASGFGGRGDDKRRGAGRCARLVAHPGRPARFHGRWERDLNVMRISVPPGWRELGEEDCDGPPDCASWITLAVDFNQDGATVTGTVTSTFAASPNYAWTVESGTIEPRC